MPPHVQSSTLAVTESTFVESFPFVARRQRQCDVLVFEPNRTGGGDSPTTNVTSTGVFLLKNPRLTKGAVDDLDDWKRIKVATLREPRRCLAFADISKNGFNDIIIVDIFEHSNASFASNRISWFENVGTNATGWKRREIGRCPGVRSVKGFVNLATLYVNLLSYGDSLFAAGHFTNTFSLQILVVHDVIAEQGSGSGSDFASFCSLTMFTQPISVTSRPPWPSSLVSTQVSQRIIDICVVRPSNVDGELDKILVMGDISVSLVWWEHGRWNTQTISTHINERSRSLSLGARTKNTVCVGGVKEHGMMEFVAYSMPFSPSKLTVCSPSSSPQSLNLQDIFWDFQILDDFSPNIITNVQSIDIGGTGGFVVSVVPCNSSSDRSQRESQLYFYYPVVGSRKQFEKLLIAQGVVLDCAVGAFKICDKSDVIALTKPCINTLNNGVGSNEITTYSLFNTPLIKASIDPSRLNGLILRLPEPSTIGQNAHKLVLFSTFSMTFSLVLLGPGQTYDLPPTAAIKVLRGAVESKQHLQHIIRRPYLTHSGNTVTESLEIDQRSLNACMHGAIFILLTKEKFVQGLRIKNYSPASLNWEEVPSSHEFFGTKVFALDGFKLLVDETDIAHVHFTAFRDRTSLNGPPPLPTLVPGPHSLYLRKLSSSRAICQVRCCIKNASKKGGMYHSNESNVSSRIKAKTTKSPGSIPNAWLLPELTESRPLWHVDDKGNPVTIDGVVSYPPVYGWLSDIEHALRKNGKNMVSNSNTQVYSGIIENGKQGDDSFDVWMDIDFTPWACQCDTDKEDCGVKTQDKGNLFFIISCGFLGAILGLLIRQFSGIINIYSSS